MSKRLQNDQTFAGPLWTVRGLPWLATLALVIAVFAGHHDVLRDGCVGAALGLLIGFCVYSWQIRTVLLKDTPQPSDVHRYPIS